MSEQVGGGGRTLEDVIDDDGPLAPEGVAQVLVDLGEGLSELAHGAITPESIVLVGPGDAERAELRDLGVVPLAEYEAPEIADGEPPSPASDVYALACVAYEALVGLPPFRGSASRIRLSHQHDSPPSVGHAGLDAVLERATAKDPEDRYTSVASFARAFERALRRPEPAVPPTPEPAARSRRTSVPPGLDGDDEKVPLTKALPVVLIVAALLAIIVAIKVISSVGGGSDDSTSTPVASATTTTPTRTTTRSAPAKATGPTGPAAPSSRVAPVQTAPYTAPQGGYSTVIPTDAGWVHAAETQEGGVLRTELTGPNKATVVIESTSGANERPFDRTGATGVVRTVVPTPDSEAISYRFRAPAPSFCAKGCLRDQARVQGRLITVTGGPTPQARGVVRAITLALQPADGAPTTGAAGGAQG